MRERAEGEEESEGVSGRGEGGEGLDQGEVQVHRTTCLCNVEVFSFFYYVNHFLIP